MKILKKLSALVLSAMLLTGCGNNTEYIPPTAEEISANAELLSGKDYCEIPDGMTFEDIRNIMYINGKQIKMPCTLKELVKSADGFTLTGSDGNEIEPEDSIMLAYLKKNNTSISTVHFQNGDISYLTTTDCTDLKVNNAVGIGDNISSLFETMNCSDKYEVKSYANEYNLWYTDGVNAVRISATADESGKIAMLLFDADETVDSIPDKQPDDNTGSTVYIPESEFAITGWTMEQLVSDITVNGVTFSLPCSPDVFAENFETEEFDFEGVNGRVWGCEVYKDEKIMAIAHYDNNKEEKSINLLMLDSLFYENSVIPEFDIMGITHKSTPDDLVEILGEPNLDNGYEYDYTYYFSANKELYVSFDTENGREIKFLRIRYIE